MSLTNGYMYIVAKSGYGITSSMSSADVSTFVNNPSSGSFTYAVMTGYSTSSALTPATITNYIAGPTYSTTATSYRTYFTIIYTPNAYNNVKDTVTETALDGSYNNDASAYIPWSWRQGSSTRAYFRSAFSSVQGSDGLTYYYVPSSDLGALIPSINLSQSYKYSYVTIHIAQRDGAGSYEWVRFQSYVCKNPYEFSNNAFRLTWNTLGNMAGISTPVSYGSSATYRCTLQNLERSDASLSSTTGAIKMGNGTSSFSGSYGSITLKSGTTVRPDYIPYTGHRNDVWEQIDASVTAAKYQAASTTSGGTGYRTATSSTDGTITGRKISSTSFTIPGGSTMTFDITVTGNSTTGRKYFLPCVSFTKVSSSTWWDNYFNYGGYAGLKFDGSAKSGAYYLRSSSTAASTGAKRVLDFQHDVEDAGSSSVTSAGNQPVLSQVPNDNYTGHLAYNGITGLGSPRFRCIDMSERIDTVFEYPSSTPTTTYTFTMVGSGCVGCSICNEYLDNCLAGIYVNGQDDIVNADQCVNCQSCFNAGINASCQLAITFAVEES